MQVRLLSDMRCTLIQSGSLWYLSSLPMIHHLAVGAEHQIKTVSRQIAALKGILSKQFEHGSGSLKVAHISKLPLPCCVRSYYGSGIPHRQATIAMLLALFKRSLMASQAAHGQLRCRLQGSLMQESLRCRLKRSSMQESLRRPPQRAPRQLSRVSQLLPQSLFHTEDRLGPPHPGPAQPSQNGSAQWWHASHKVVLHRFGGALHRCWAAEGLQ